MVLFGPAGNSARFYEEGHKATVDAPKWLADQGLTAMEYSAGRGVTLSEKTARAIGEQARLHGIALSLHAPYYINCATADPDKREKTLGYLMDAARACHHLGGNRVVFHVGAPKGLHRAEANRLAERTVGEALLRLDDQGLSHIALCPETMGRPSQLGTLQETLALCQAHPRLIPTLDFGHIHTMGLGCLNTAQDFAAVLDQLIAALGMDRARRFHAHFSHIAFTAKGEKRHMSFADPGYGPDFALLAPLLKSYTLAPTIICESKDTQSDDALTMRRAYDACAEYHISATT